MFALRGDKESNSQTPPGAADCSPSLRHESASSSSTKTGRACDLCRKRKVRCNGGRPCLACTKSLYECAYDQPRQPKGPKGLRSANVLQGSRPIDRVASTNAKAKVPLSPDGAGPLALWNTAAQQPASPDELQTASLNSSVQFIDTSINFANPAPQPHAPAMFVSAETPEFPSTYPILSDGVSHFGQNYLATNIQADCSVLNAFIPQTPQASGPSVARISGELFIPYMRLFYQHLFPIMPIIDHNTYLDPETYTDSQSWSSDMYCFVCAICAATVVQLDTSIIQPARIDPNMANDDYFANACLSERDKSDHRKPNSTLTIMTSFFLFAYYGNHEDQQLAWYYLQESITFLQNLKMDNERSYHTLDLVESQWRRRLYWLLFITERAYAVQTQNNTRLQPYVELPEALEREDSKLLNGFVNLARLFSAVGDDFVRVWRNKGNMVCDVSWLAGFPQQLDNAVFDLSNITETQRLDISITKEWLHILAWYMGVFNQLTWSGPAGITLDYPIQIARNVVAITNGADQMALDSHGIGMEQKLSDIGGALVDVLKCYVGSSSSVSVNGRACLNFLLQRLSTIRGRESRYFKPLRMKMQVLPAGYELPNPPLLLPSACSVSLMAEYSENEWSEWSEAAPPSSTVGSVDVLRRLSLSGNLGMPGLGEPPLGTAQAPLNGQIFNCFQTEWV